MASKSEVQTFEVLELELSQLAAVFRGSSVEKGVAVAANYRQLLNKLYEIGWNEALLFEAELPDVYMPAWYWQQYPTLQISPDEWER